MLVEAYPITTFTPEGDTYTTTIITNAGDFDASSRPKFYIAQGAQSNDFLVNESTGVSSPTNNAIIKPIIINLLSIIAIISF